MTEPTWPSVEDATRRINVLIEGQVEGPEADMAARDLSVLMRELGRVTDENRRLREALDETRRKAMTLGYTDLAHFDAALRYAAASGEAEDRARDAMKAQVYPDLWPGPSLGQQAPPTQDEAISIPQLEELRERLSEFGNNGLDASTCLGLLDTIAALRRRGSPP